MRATSYDRVWLMRAHLVIALVSIALVACDALIGANFDRPATADGGATFDGACDPARVNADPFNCGRCGHDCLGGACNAGTCQPVVLASGRSRPTDVAVAAGYVYWTEEGTSATNTTDGKVARVPIAGCMGGEAGASSSCVTELATQRRAPSGIAVNSEAVYWTEAGTTTGAGGAVMRLGFDNAPMSTFASAQGGPRKIAVDDPNTVVATPSAYWVNGNSGEVRRRFLVDGTPNGSAIVTGIDAPVGIALSGGRVCFTSFGQTDFDGAVACSDVTGSGKVTLASAQAAPRGLAIAGTNVYWAASGDGTIRSATTNGSGKKVVITSLKTPSDVVVAGGSLYWVESGTAPNFDDGSVATSDLDGTNVVTLAAGRKNPRALVLDANAVYWVDSGSTFEDAYDGAVVKVALP